jgi:outer membrane protein TolC
MRLRSGRAGRWRIVLALALALAPGAVRANPAELGLADAVRETLASNLDLAAQRRTLASDREDVELARARLLPQVTLGARAQELDDNRSDDIRGNNAQRSLTLAAQLTQVLYDENDWAAFEIQEFVYAAKTQQLAASRLAVAQEAANAFLELDRGRTLLRVQEANRELTRRNLETSKARVAAGWSGERDVLRWESQLAQNGIGVAQARTGEQVSRFALNRLRNQPRESAYDVRTAGFEAYGFVYARESIAGALTTPDANRKLREAMVHIGRKRSPVLAAIDEGIAAAERQLAADRRAFWVPSLSVGGGINHLAADNLDRDSDLADTEWKVAADLSFPLVQGGAKFASVRQTREALASLRLERRAQVVTLGERVGAAFAQASGTWEALGFAQEQERLARRYFELVDASYVAGVASTIALLDGQAQLLRAQLAAVNARIDFLEALVAAEREIAFFPFLEPEAEVTALLDSIERELTGP